MCLQALIEIGHADAGIDDCKDDQDNRNDGKTSQTLPDRKVERCVAGLIHPDELEDEVSQPTVVHENGEDRSNFVFSARPHRGHE